MGVSVPTGTLLFLTVQLHHSYSSPDTFINSKLTGEVGDYLLPKDAQRLAKACLQRSDLCRTHRLGLVQLKARVLPLSTL